MAEAIRLSLTHLGQTSTNPSVGCVIVRDGVVVGRGVTAVGGRPHAETEALKDAGDKARGTTAYVTLEPCAHHGKTPPCADALVAAGISRVVVSLVDPDERVAGRGLRILRDAGISVETGLLEKESRRALAGYLMRKTRARPHVTLKLAVSADGMIGRRDAGQVAITGPAARHQVHLLRGEVDAILVGIGTALADDPELTVRIPGLEGRSPVRIVLDRRLELPPTSKLARTARDVPVIVVTDAVDAAPLEGGIHDTKAESADSLAHRRDALEAVGVEILEADTLADLLSNLAARGMSMVLVEGGAGVARAFLEAGLVDRIMLFTGPGEIGAGGIVSPITSANIPCGFTLYRSETFGPDRCDYFEREP